MNHFAMHAQFTEDTLETMSGEWKSFVSALFTLYGSTACCWFHLPQLGPAYAKKGKTPILIFFKCFEVSRANFQHYVITM